MPASSKARRRSPWRYVLRAACLRRRVVVVAICGQRLLIVLSIVYGVHILAPTRFRVTPGGAQTGEKNQTGKEGEKDVDPALSDIRRPLPGSGRFLSRGAWR